VAVLSSIPPEMAAEAESHGVIMPMTACVEASGGHLARARTEGAYGLIGEARW
jgi:hypothetical protein